MSRRVSPLLLWTLLLSTAAAFQLTPPKSSIPTPPSSKPTVETTVPSPLNDAILTAQNFAATIAVASSIAIGTLSLQTPPAHAVDTSRTIQVQIDAPVLARRLKAKFYEKELLDALKQVQDVIGPDAIKITPPSNIAGAARDLISGRGEITVNGQPVDVAILSSEKGEITVRISNSLIPKIPILSTSANVPFSGTASQETADDDSEVDWGVLADVARVFGVDLTTPVVDQVARVYGWDWSTNFVDQKFFGGIVGIPLPRAEDNGGTFTYVPTNKDVAGATSLAVGGAYGYSYYYYQALIAAKEKAAEEKKAATDKAKEDKAKKAREDKAAKKAEPDKAKAEKADESATADKAKEDEAAKKAEAEKAEAEKIELEKAEAEKSKAEFDAKADEPAVAEKEAEVEKKADDDAAETITADADDDTTGENPKKKSRIRRFLTGD